MKAAFCGLLLLPQKGVKPLELFKIFGTIALNNHEANNELDETKAKGESLKDKLGSAFEKIGSAAVTCGKTIATGLAAGATAMAGLTMKALNAAGELEQNMGGSEAVFKEHATGMQETANTAFEKMGLSASDFLATANKMGALFQGSGIDIEKSADLSSQAMQRAADVASIMGIDIGAAMESIAGAAKGNFTMMDNLGVAMNDTALEAYAMAKGLTRASEASVDMKKLANAQDSVAKATLTVEAATERQRVAIEKYGANSTQATQATIALEKAQIGLEAANRKVNEVMAGSQKEKSWYSTASQQEKITLAMEMFLEKTAYAAGNYAKENRTLAGSLTTAKAAMMNFLSGAGSVDGLVSSLVNAGEVISENLTLLLPRLIDGMNELAEELLPHVPELVEKLLPGIIEGAIILLNSVVRILPSLMQIIISQLPNIITQLANGFRTTFPILLDTVRQLFSQVFNFISVGLLGTSVDFETTIVKIQGFFQGLWEVMLTIWESVGKPIFDIIKQALVDMAFIFSQKMPEVKAFVMQCFDDIRQLWTMHLKPCFDAIGAFIKNILAPTFETVFNSYIARAVETAFNHITSLWNDVLMPVMTGIIDFITGVFTLNWKQAWEALESIVKGICNGVINGIETMMNGAIDALNALIDGINKIIKKAGEVMGLKVQIPNIPNISLPRLEEGGILEKGQIGLLEGNGAEAVVPLDQNRAWISALAKDMEAEGLVGGNRQQTQRIIELLETLIDMLPDSMKDAFATMKMEFNKREVARMVKAVN